VATLPKIGWLDATRQIFKAGDFADPYGYVPSFVLSAQN
jgi:hypothetical protein